MFDALSDRLQAALGSLTGRGRITEEDVDTAMREVRMALLEADVNYAVAKKLVSNIRDQALEIELGFVARFIVEVIALRADDLGIRHHAIDCVVLVYLRGEVAEIRQRAESRMIDFLDK